MDQERFEKLKQRATKVFSDLNALTGGRGIIHERNMLSTSIDIQLLLLEKEGEHVIEYHRLTLHVSLDKLEGYIDEAEDFIVEVKRGPREV